MSDGQNLEDKKNQVETCVEDKTTEFLKIRDYSGEVVYTSSLEELEKALTDILSTGSFTKTFNLWDGKIQLTYQSISEKERMQGYKLIREYTDKNKDNLSKIEHDAYQAKVNLALQLTRITVNKIPTNISQGQLEERILLLMDTAEDQIRLYGKYLSIFANITARAFSSEEVLKNS